jgi:hypothetical protein
MEFSGQFRGATAGSRLNQRASRNRLSLQKQVYRRLWPRLLVRMMMLVGMYQVIPASALIVSMHPAMMFAPGTGDPHPFVALVPIAWTIGIIRPVTELDIQLNSHRAGTDKHANRQKSHRKNRQFCFHSIIICSHESGFLDASRQSQGILILTSYFSHPRALFIPSRVIASINCGYFRPAFSADCAKSSSCAR